MVLAIFVDSYDGPLQHSNYAIVLGNKVDKKGHPSKRLEARLMAAYELYAKGLIDKIIVSGGFGKEGFDEASVMARYLISKTVNPDDIIMDHQGINTHSTSINARAIIPETNRLVTVVSQQYHVSRAKLSLKNAGFKRIQGYYPHYYEWRDIYAYAREVPAWIKYWCMAL